ncbi:MAG: segregation/condensation protein A [Spirochaetes bacterium]|nr:segregation/condensation protein A [Spirochaetota bacterium]
MGEEKDTGYTVKLEKFEGPMDLLLYLINKAEIDIYDIPIGEITEQYLKYINLMKKIDINVSAEFIVMAATLMYIKSKMLIPTDVEIEDEYFEDPRKELVEQILEYQKFKNAADDLKQKEEEVSNVFFRPSSQMVMEFGDAENWVDVKLLDLINIFSKFIEYTDTEDLGYILPERITVGTRIDQISEILKEKDQIDFQSLFVEKVEVWDVVVTFLAILEMIKQRKIFVKQHKLFGDIKIFRREGK